MKIIFEIENPEDAVDAQNMLAAYLSVEEDVKIPKAVAKVEPKEEKKVPATRAKDSVKKDAPKTKPKPEPKPEPEEEEEPVVEGGEVTLAELTQIAKDAVARTDRATVKDTIGEYGEKLSAVEEKDYTELAQKLKELE